MRLKRLFRRVFRLLGPPGTYVTEIGVRLAVRQPLAALTSVVSRKSFSYAGKRPYSVQEGMPTSTRQNNVRNIFPSSCQFNLAVFTMKENGYLSYFTADKVIPNRVPGYSAKQQIF